MSANGALACTEREDMARYMEDAYGYRRITRTEYERRVRRGTRRARNDRTSEV